MISFNYFQIKSNKVNYIPNFYLNFDKVWNKETQDKLVSFTDEIMALISTKGIEKYIDGKQQWSLSLYADKGNGVGPKGLKQGKYSDILATHSTKIKPEGISDIRPLIASMAVYLFAFPEAIATIKIGVKNLLFADIHGLRTPEYILSTSYASILGVTDFIWDKNEGSVTRKTYDALVKKFEKNEDGEFFALEDIIYYLGCHNHLDNPGIYHHMFDYIYFVLERFFKKQKTEIYDFRHPSDG